MSNQHRAKVGIVRIQKDETIESCVRKGLNLIEAKKPTSDATIVIKPNLCRAMSPETGATTDTRIVEALVKILREQAPNCTIAIVESDTNVRTAEEVFDRMGYVELAEQHNVKLINLTKDRKFSVEVPIYSRNVNFPMTLMNCDRFISVAKMKTYRPFHKITCNMKNLFGCIPAKHKVSLHTFQPELTTGLGILLNPDLCIVDGITAMEGFGPIGGKPKPMNLMVFGNNIFSTDFVVAEIMGFEPRKVPMIKCAMKHVNGVDDVEVRGEPIDSVRSRFDYSSPALEISLAEFVERLGLATIRFGTRIKEFGDSAYRNPFLFVEQHMPRFIFYRLREWAWKRYRKRAVTSLA
jgi:uncharacterized protein (DUF362 family)